VREHEAILQRVMREAFRPHGLLQKGRSRVWFGDRGWWVTVVELQPSGWSKGSYLNVGAMWLVYPQQHVTFHDGYRRGGNEFLEFKDAAQFETGARGLCASAIDVVDDLKRRICSYSDAYSRQEELLTEERARAGPAGPWNLFYTALFGLLTGHRQRAVELTTTLQEYPAQWEWEHSMKAIALQTLQASDVERTVHDHIATTRAAFKLPEWRPGEAA
jgi:hypothetical protein